MFIRPLNEVCIFEAAAPFQKLRHEKLDFIQLVQQKWWRHSFVFAPLNFIYNDLSSAEC